MAKETDNPFDEQASEDGGQRIGMKMILRLGLMVAVLAVGSAGGYVMGGRINGPAEDPNAAAAQEAPEDFYDGSSSEPSSVASEEFVYIEFEPIIANLDDEQMLRYIRAKIILAVSKEDEAEATKMLDGRNKKIEVRGWVTSYLAGQTIESIKGQENHNRIRREIRENINQLLWPRRKPVIDHITFDEFTVQ